MRQFGGGEIVSSLLDTFYLLVNPAMFLVLPQSLRINHSFPHCLIRSLTMLWASLLAFTALANAAPTNDAVPAYLQKRQGSQTMLRFGCSQVVIDRLDPLVNPGQAPSPHNHQVCGSKAETSQEVSR
jgi:hypothetical protein